MKILYIHQYFKTPAEPGGTRSYWIAKELIDRGHDVVMVTTKTTLGQEYDVEAVSIDGIKVLYSNVPYNQNMTIQQRLKSFFSFMIRATKFGWKEKGIDMVIASSTPLTVGFPALMLKWFKKKPYIFEVRDLWPEVPIQMGGLNNPILKWLARWFEKTIYRNAEHVVALSPGMKDGVVKYISKERTSMIPNMAKINEFWPREKDRSLVKQLGLKPNSFKVIHFGALGMANGADYIVEAANLLKDHSEIEFVFAGGGSTENELKEKCNTLELTNVHFLGRFPMREISEIVNFCDISLVSFLDIPVLYTNSPNKLFDSLSAGKSIIVNSNGWTRELVETEHCGYFVDPKNPQELADKIVFLQKNQYLVNEMGVNARALAENKFDKSLLCSQFADVVDRWMNHEKISI